MGTLIGLPLFIVAPCAIAAWIGTRIRSPVIAFAVTWVLTPIVSLVTLVVFWPVMRALTPSNNDGTGAIMIPFYGIVTGAIAGVVAAKIVQRRRADGGAKPAGTDQNQADAPSENCNDIS